MKIKISEATDKEIGDFEEKAWRGEDLEHYGEPVSWIVKKFIFKASENGKIVGVTEGKFEAGVVYISTLIVAKGKRRQGIGEMLAKRVEKFGRDLGTHKIFLFTMEEWEAGRFYEKLGYKKTGNLPHHYLKRNFTIYSKLI